LTYSITWDKKTVYCKFYGEVSGQELVECNMSMYGNPNLDNTRFQVFDMLDVTKAIFSPNDVKKVAAFDRAAAKIWPRMKCALVSTNQIALELSKIYQNEIHRSTWEGKSFQGINEALEWLYQPPRSL
jgi:hypothetical protein